VRQTGRYGRTKVDELNQLYGDLCAEQPKNAKRYLFDSAPAFGTDPLMHEDMSKGFHGDISGWFTVDLIVFIIVARHIKNPLGRVFVDVAGG
jgi:hypothetical protein